MLLNTSHNPLGEDIYLYNCTTLKTRELEEQVIIHLLI